MDFWIEPIDRQVGRAPIVRSTGHDVIYELRVSGGQMRDALFSPAPRLRLELRCDDRGKIYARTVTLPKGAGV